MDISKLRDIRAQGIASGLVFVAEVAFAFRYNMNRAQVLQLNQLMQTLDATYSAACFQNMDGSTSYIILDKAIYGPRSTGLSWQKHLAGLLAQLGLFPSLIDANAGGGALGGAGCGAKDADAAKLPV